MVVKSNKFLKVNDFYLFVWYIINKSIFCYLYSVLISFLFYMNDCNYNLFLMINVFIKKGNFKLKMIIFVSFKRKVCKIYDIITFKKEIYDKWGGFML